MEAIILRKDDNVKENKNIVDIAMYYRNKLNLPIIPIDSNTHYPLINNSELYCDLPPDESDIIGWWQKNPAADIGLIASCKTDFVVLETDKKAIEKVKSRFLPPTPRVITPSGKVHFYFKYSDINPILNRFNKGYLRLYTGGEIVPAPPSTINEGTYKFNNNYRPEDTIFYDIPGWIIDLCNKGIEKNEKQTPLSDLDRGDFIPSDTAKAILEYIQNSKGQHWSYIPDMKVFYSYRQSEGYWKQTNDEYLKSQIRKKLRDINRKWDKSYYIRETMQAVKHLLIDDKTKDRFTVDPDNSNHYLNTKTGMLDWKKGIIKPHKPAYYSRFQFPVEYVPGAQCPTWIKSLNQWVDDEDTIKFLQEFIGYCLIKDTSQHVAVILHGSGSNGKSTLLDVLIHLFGEENLTNIDLQRLSNRFEIANIKDVLVNICSDIDSTYMTETGLLKTLIAGEKLRGEFKHRDSFDFKPIVRLIFSANEIPKVRDKTEGWYRRLRIIRFPHTFKKGDPGFDPYLKEKLKDELPGIFNWAIEGLKRYRKNKGFTISQSMKMAKREYKNENDSVMSFVNEKLIKHDVDQPDWVIAKSVLYREYKAYCEESGLNAVSRWKFTHRLKNLGFEDAKRRVPDYSQYVNSSDINDFFNNKKDVKKVSKRCFIKIELRTD